MPAYLRSSLFAALTAVFALGCGGGDDDPDPPPEKPDNGPASLVLGTGVSALEDLTNGDDLAIVQGEQGGYHLFASFAVTGIECGNPVDPADETNPTMTFSVFNGVDRVDIESGNRFTQGLRPLANSTAFGVVGRTVFLQLSCDDELDGATLRMALEVADVDGITLTDERTITAFADPNNDPCP